jgi:hypothetical protein
MRRADEPLALGAGVVEREERARTETREFG